MTPLQKAAQSLLEQHLPTYLDQNVAKLRKALDAEIAQVVDPVDQQITQKAYELIDTLLRNVLHDDEYACFSEALEAVYLHPPQPQAMTAVLRECWYESNELKVCRKCGQLHDKAIAAQGEKP